MAIRTPGRPIVTDMADSLLAQPVSGTASGAGRAGGTRTRSNIEVFIPTFNEEINLPHALASVVGWADAVYVVDSNSTDRTREIAEAAGAKVVVQKWLGYAKQKNWALDNLPFQSDWVFILDADESILPELREELIAKASKPVDSVRETGFYVNRLTHFMGRPIRHCGYFPSYNLRFFKRGKARYEDREVHEHMNVDGPTARMKHIMLHEDRRGLEHFIAKHNRYSTLEARELIKGAAGKKEDAPRELERGIAIRRWLKYHVQPRLPLPGFWRFMYMYVFRLGFLDGATGFRFALLLSTYDFFISLKLHELKNLLGQGNTGAMQGEAAKGLALPEGTISNTAAVVSAPADASAARANGQASPAGTPAPAPVVPASPRIAPSTPAPTAAGRQADSVAVAPKGKDDRRPFMPSDVPHCPRPPVSVIILAYNEEGNMRQCIESCSWCDDVHVLDSGSKDRTREISEQLGAKVHINPFKSFGQQRNWAIDNIPVKHRWQFQLDADERFTPALVREMFARLKGDVNDAVGGSLDGASAYQCPSMMMFMDHWLRHAAEYPVYQVRLIDTKRARYEDYGHGQREVVSGETDVLEMPYLHYNFSKGLEEWLDKHNRYSSLEANQALNEPPVVLTEALSDIFSGDAVRRRRRLKALVYRMPAKSTAIMLYTMFFRLGFLDGKAGWNYARLRALYESMIAVKMSVVRHRRKMLGRDEGSVDRGM